MQTTTSQFSGASVARPVSAPPVGDQSLAFTYATTIAIAGQQFPVTDDAIVFRVGSSIGLVETGGLTTRSDINQTIALAKAQVLRMKSAAAPVRYPGGSR